MMWPFRSKTAVEQRSITNIDGWPWDTGGPPPGSSINVSKALSLVPVFGAVRLLADSIASLTPIVYTMRSDGVPRKQPTPSLFTQPSLHGTTFDWLHRAVVSMALQGDAVGLITQRDYYGWPTMVEWLNPEQVTVQDTVMSGPGSYVNPLWWWWGNPVSASDLVHIPWFSLPYQVRGLSPIGAFKLTAGVGLGAQEYAAQWFSNGGVPPGTLRNTAKTIDQAEADLISRRLVSRLRSRRPFVYGSDWVYEPIAIKPHEAQFIETAQLTASQIAVIYGIPPERIGGTIGGSSLTYACADEETEILTKRGWLHFDDIAADDICLTLNTDTGLSEWQSIDAVNVFSGPHEVIKMENTSHSSVTTPDHRWPVTFLTPLAKKQQPNPRTAGFNWRTTETLSSDARICAAAPVSAPVEAKWSDALVELIAWLWTEGWIGEYGSVTFAQSQAINPAYVSRIRAAITEIFGPEGDLHVRSCPSWREDLDDRGLVHFRLNKKAGAVLLPHAPNKVVSTEFLSELTHAQLELFIQTSIDADGSRSHTTMIGQKDRARLDAFQIACLLAGKSGQVTQHASGRWSMCINKRPWRKPTNHREHITRLTIDGPVWCPTTENGTWFARRNGTVYATGNSLEQRSMDFLTFSLRPWLVRLETALSRLFPRGTYVKFDTRELLRTDAKTRAEINALSLGTSPPAWREVDEVRASEDLPPMPKLSAQTPLPPTQPVVVNPKVNGNNQPRYLRERINKNGK